MNGNFYYSPPYNTNEPFDELEYRQMKKSFSRLLLSLSVYTIVAYLVILIVDFALIALFGFSIAQNIAGNIYFTWIMQVLSMYVIAFPVLLLIVRGLPKSKKEKSKISLEEFTTTFLICEAVMLIGSIVSESLTSAISSILGYEVSNATSELIMDSPVWLIILIAVFIGPIIEELIFRKVFIDATSRYGDRLAIIVSSVAFGLFHGNFSQFFYAAGLGLILGYVYTKTGNVIYTCILHILLNFFGTVPALLAGDSIARLEEFAMQETLSAQDSFAMLGDTIKVLGVSISQYALAAMGVIALIISITKRKIRLPESEPEIYVPKSKITSAVILNVGGIMFLVISAGQFILSLLP